MAGSCSAFIFKIIRPPNARFILFDACFNGSFHLDDNIVGSYIFNKGKTIATMAVSYTHLDVYKRQPTFIVYNEWNKPEDVKKVIVKLYKKDKLEGVVFVGEMCIRDRE